MNSISVSRLINLNVRKLRDHYVRHEFSVRDVVNEYVRKIEQVNPSLNALVVPLFEQAMQRAAELDEAHAQREVLGPLHGVPVTVKESIEIAGTPSTLGLSSRLSHTATADAPQVQRLKKAGAVILGKTNVSLLLKAYESDNPVYGRTNNPWDLGRAPGGSSGGEGAIVAAGGSVLGLGSDLGGSIRLPAHACGVHALRPTTGRLSMLGHARTSSAQGAMMSQPAPIARSVEDLELVMEVLAAPGQDVFDASVPPVPLSKSSHKQKLKAAFFTDNGILRPTPAIRRAVLEAAEALERNGAEVEEWCPPDLHEAWEIQLRLMCADGLASYRQALKNSRGAKVKLAAMPKALRSLLSLLADVGGQKKLASSIRFKHKMSIGEYFETLGRRRLYASRFFNSMGHRGFDVIVCPPDALPALKHGSSYYVSGCDISYAGLFTLLGMPAGVVAATRVRAGEETDRVERRDLVEKAARYVENGSTGLPVGVQVSARPWREDIVLGVMGVLENSFRQRPDYPVLPELAN